MNAELSKEEVRVKCSEVMGWTNLVANGCHRLKGISPRKRRCNAPDYCRDLRACAELRASLTTYKQQWIYTDALLSLTKGDHVGPPFWLQTYLCLNATAEQHCRAFLKAKGAL